ncbi:B12-binding domain-containing radical SAM protein [Methanocaldococcus fervens]|uniref:Radical SAM domain protein n=1 Tax=Methanocaldococcus fervens (strain DSM 4213 / JCM 15782 / AG86) TaxID=573064 RepID=C7P6C2_METFA|nr:radical SAM protein [Methanocaldococcus fervens]ACV24104.1 Radical SAM domain protein [Methanocaldococcus fervens AG86]
MVRIVLSTDETLTSTYHNVPLLDFLGCAPVDNLPGWVFKILDSQIPDRNGILTIAPYGLRKIEAALLTQGFKREEVVVAHPRKIEKFIDKNTTIVSLYEMDPLGLGPVSMMFTNGGRWKNYTSVKFKELVEKINTIREKKGYKFKLVVGGPGAWQIDFRKEEKEKLKIDHVIIGEGDHVAADIFRSIESGDADETIIIKTLPKVEEIPTIVKPSYKGLVEVMRGCGRGCRFCDPNLRVARYIPIEKIEEEIKVNINAGINRAWLHSEDVFLYKVEDKKNLYPNAEAVIELFEKATKYTKNVNPTHGSVAGALANPGMIEKISRTVGAGKKHWIGIQVGFETASPKLMEKYMNNKMKPFSPEEWPWVMLNGTYVLNKNYWFPAYTTILGLPEESEEDEIMTTQLILTMEKELEEKLGNRAHFTVTPLAFVPMGLLRDKEFFDVEEMMTEGRFLHLYYAWRHLYKEVIRGLPMVMRGNLFLLPFYPLARLGARLVVEHIRKWGIKLGFNPDKKLEPLDVKIDVDEHKWHSNPSLIEEY